MFGETNTFGEWRGVSLTERQNLGHAMEPYPDYTEPVTEGRNFEHSRSSSFYHSSVCLHFPLLFVYIPLLLALFRLSLLPSSSILSISITLYHVCNSRTGRGCRNVWQQHLGESGTRVCLCVAVCKVGHVHTGTQHASDKYWQLFEWAVSWTVQPNYVKFGKDANLDVVSHCGCIDSCTITHYRRYVLCWNTWNDTIMIRWLHVVEPFLRNE